MILLEQRNHWNRGLIRHLRIDDECPPDTGYAIRVERDGGVEAGGSIDIVYTLVLHPCNERHQEKLRAQIEAHPGIGGPFSPERDLGGCR